MRHKWILGVYSLIIFGFLFLGCENGNDTSNTGGGNNAPTITITGIPKVGERIIATSTGEFSDKYYRWAWSDKAADSFISEIFYDYGMPPGPCIFGENHEEFVIPEWTSALNAIPTAGNYIFAFRQSLTGVLIRSNTFLVTE
jgi:hypothetical protein